MIYKMFSIFDSKLAVFTKPFYELSEAGAMRSFHDAVTENTPGNQWYKHPEDYSLFYVGEFDDNMGSITGIIPRSLVTAASFSSNGYKKEPVIN